jgi:hypothetical protein
VDGRAGPDGDHRIRDLVRHLPARRHVRLMLSAR